MARTLPDRPVPLARGCRGAAGRARWSVAGGRRGTGRGDRGTGGRRRARARRDGRAAVTSGSSSAARAGGARRRLADERLGPERRAVRHLARRRRGRGGRRRLAGRPVRTARGHSVGFTTGATMAIFTGSPRRGMRSSRERAGTWSATGSSARRRSRWSSARRRTSRSTRRSRCWGSDASAVIRVRPDEQGRMRAGRAARGARGARRTAHRLRPGGQREHRRVRPAAGDRRGRPRANGGWLHVDGAFGLWAAVEPVAAAPGRRASASPTPGRRTPTSG